MNWGNIKKRFSDGFIRGIFILISVILLNGCNISGKVTLDGNGLEGVSVMLSGNGTEKKALTDSNGDYAFKNIGKGIYQVTVSPPEGFTGTPTQTVEKLNNGTSLSDINFAMESDTIKNLRSGKIIGKQEENGIAVWYGIPFAQPPVDALRWKAPIAEDAWEETYMATTPCKPCTQFAGMLSGFSPEYFDQVMGSEDCLYLNVWAPQNDASELRPVMFFVHGGGNSSGEGYIYNGKMLAEKYGVVVVVINYRLGPFGWLAHPALRGAGTTPEDQSGNFGTLDIIRALKWVQENIETFGGDKNSVTLFGESAGAINSLTLLASPLTEGLFSRVIAESPVIEWIGEYSNWQPMSVAENYMDDEDPGYHYSSREIVNDLLMEDGLAVDREAAKTLQDSMGNGEIEDYLRSMSAEKIMSLFETKHGGMIIMPTAIQDGYVIPKKNPLALFQSGEFNHVPVILGSNRDEYKFFLMQDENYAINLLEKVPLVTQPTNYALASHYYSDAWKITAVDELANAISAHQPNDIYVYRFDWDEEPTILGVDVSFMVGAAHGVELPSVFADPDMVIIQLMSMIQTSANRPGRVFLADSMSSYWSAMAYNGSPGTGMPNAPQTVLWTPWSDVDGKENLMIFDTPADAGIHMTNFHLYSDDLKEALQNETGFTTDADYCRVYHDIYGEDDFYQVRCKDL